jgi:phage tail sheath protein FI
MPEYLAPGVFVEEVSYRSKSIEGVPTSTTGFAGLTRYGPVCYPGGPTANEPRLVTSYAEFERVYGALDPLETGTLRIPYLAHAARAYFLNGGCRLYVARVYRPQAGQKVALAESRVVVTPDSSNPVDHTKDRSARFVARWPGVDGNVTVTVTAVRGGDVGLHPTAADLAAGTKGWASGAVSHGTILEVVPAQTVTDAQGNQVKVLGSTPAPDAALALASLRFFHRTAQGAQTFVDKDGHSKPPERFDLLLPITLTVTVTGAERSDSYSRMGITPLAPGSLARVLDWDDPVDDSSRVAFEFPANPQAGGVVTTKPPATLPPLPTTPPADPDTGLAEYLTLAFTLQDNSGQPSGSLKLPLTRAFQLAGGTDGEAPTPETYLGDGADPDDATKKATGLEALAEVDDIAIVALPDAGAIEDDDARFTATQYLIRHAEECRYRIAVVDGPQSASMNEIRSFRGNFDSKYAALYHPWIEILDPNGPPAPGVPTPRLQLPPSGFVTGIYARSDITRGVFKAPANEVVFGLTRFEMNVNQGRNEVLNPEHINALRFFPGRGNRVWGARTLSTDPEWLYVNVRRLFIYLEHSIDKATQWAVFEPNGEALWAMVTRMVKEFLEVQWRNGALLGATPEEAFFVLCDRSTMSQNDLDNGRLICLVGVAPVKPAEFVIFRIGQWTADAQG